MYNITILLKYIHAQVSNKSVYNISTSLNYIVTLMYNINENANV